MQLPLPAAPGPASLVTPFPSAAFGPLPLPPFHLGQPPRNNGRSAASFCHGLPAAPARPLLPRLPHVTVIATLPLPATSQGIKQAPSLPPEALAPVFSPSRQAGLPATRRCLPPPLAAGGSGFALSLLPPPSRASGDEAETWLAVAEGRGRARELRRQQRRRAGTEGGRPRDVIPALIRAPSLPAPLRDGLDDWPATAAAQPRDEPPSEAATRGGSGGRAWPRRGGRNKRPLGAAAAAQ